MTNIMDYLKWRGDIIISDVSPFNEVDSVILARLAYLSFHEIEMDKIETIESIANKMKDLDISLFRYKKDKDFIINLGNSERFKNMQITNYTENNEKENEKQFSAITIHTEKNEMYVSFIGTTASIYGWKEDFNMAFLDSVPCQIEGMKYLAKVAQEYQNKKIRVGGHSKGGNVAIYSALTNPSLQNRIIKVYNFDGPGFHKKFIEKYGKSPILEKIESYFPQDSIIGRIMNHKEKYSIVESNEKGIRQHNLYSWKVMGSYLINSKKLTDASEIMNKTVTNWLEETTSEQRKIFIDSVFELFYATDENTFLEISSHLSKNLSIILKKYNEITDEDKKIISDMMKLFMKSYFSEVLVQEKQKYITRMKQLTKKEVAKV